MWPHHDWEHYTTREKERDWLIRSLLIRQFWLGLLDILVLLSVIVLIFFPWRRKAIVEAWKLRLWTVSDDPLDSDPSKASQRGASLHRLSMDQGTHGTYFPHQTKPLKRL